MFHVAVQLEQPRAWLTQSLLGHAMVAISEASFGIQRAELLRETLALMGGRRLTPGIEARLMTALQATIDNGRPKERASGLIGCS